MFSPIFTYINLYILFYFYQCIYNKFNKFKSSGTPVSFYIYSIKNSYLLQVIYFIFIYTEYKLIVYQ